MKTKLFAKSCIACLACWFLAHDATGAAAPELFEKAIYTEETKGDLPAAARLYQEVVDDPAADRTLAAQAQLRLGLCQLKLGNKPEAISALDRLRQDFPDKDKLMSIVEQHMPQVLEDIVQQIEGHYIFEVDGTELIETAIRAVAGKLDGSGQLFRPNDMEFLDANALKNMNEQIEQKIAGIGAELRVSEEDVVVQALLPASPALRAGLRAGDRIVMVNGIALPETQKLETAIKLLRGPVGTAVRVSVRRPGSASLQEIQFVRDIIRLPSVLGDGRKADNTPEFMLDEAKKIGYVRLTYLGQQSAEEMKAALAELERREMKVLILDLRSCPGGLLDAAVETADLFLDHGVIVTVRGRTNETVYRAKEEGTQFPLAVLVNRKTASAAEIVAASLQDNERAVMIGERSFGQGIVRGTFQLKNGGGAIKLPVAAFYRPNGKGVNRYPMSKDSDDWGVSPDPECEVNQTEEELNDYEKARSTRDRVSAGTKTELVDPVLAKALEYMRGKVE